MLVITVQQFLKCPKLGGFIIRMHKIFLRAVNTFMKDNYLVRPLYNQAEVQLIAIIVD